MLKKSICITAIASTIIIHSLSTQAIAGNVVTIKSNFIGTTYGDTNTTPYYPPDGNAAVGVNDVVELTNGSYAVYDKSGNLLGPRKNLGDFWQAAGITAPNSIDPRVIYDPLSGHYFASSTDSPNTVGNNLLVAVSNDSNPLDGWKGFSYPVNKPGAQTSADFPTIGLTSNTVNLSVSLLGTPTGSSIVTIDKASLIAGTPVAQSIIGVNASAAGFVIQPTFEPGFTTTQYLLSRVSNNLFQKSVLTGSPIDNSVTLQTPTNPATNSANFVTISNLGPPPNARQPNGNNTIDTNDSRFSSKIIYHDGLLWGTQNVRSANGTAGIRWFAIDPLDTNYPTALKQSGVISDPNLDFYYSSIAINPAGDILIGFTGSGPSQYASSYAVTGKTSGGTTTFDTPFVLEQGSANYNLGGANNSPWGNYSSTSIDPTDPTIFWTSQQFASATDVWSIQTTEINIKPASQIKEVPESNLNLGLFVLTGLALATRVKRK